MVSYWLGRFGGSERRMILLAALVLLPVLFLPILPIWEMRLWAPQYREGLRLTIYTNTIQGDIDKINTLNHYVGMKAITAADFREFAYMPQLLTGFGVMALLAALTGWRWLALIGWLGFTAFAGFMFNDYVRWLWRYGHELDPRAAITLDQFMPPVIGFQRMANFRVLSMPAAGTLLLCGAWLLGPIVLLLERRAARIAGVRTAAIAAGCLVLGGTATPAAARTHHAPPDRAQSVLAAAADGDTVVLEAGRHRGRLRIERSITLRGEPGAIVDGGGTGSVVIVAAAGVVIQDLTLGGSGGSVMDVDAGIHVERVRGARLIRLSIHDVLYGVNAERASDLEIRECRLQGRVQPMDERGEGNGLHLWYCSDARLVGNRVERFLDAIYLSFANGIDIEGNVLRWNGRFGLHTMYCQDNRLARNVFTQNVAGCALMFSNRLAVEHNDFVHNRGPRTYGLLLRDCSDGTFTANRLADNTIGVFMDGSNRNRLHGNLVEDNGWGVLIFSSCANNVFVGNHFIQNDYPVALDMRRTSNRFDDGSTGNYWSDNAAYDLDADGVGDVPYAPVSTFAFVSKQYPDLTVLAKSPAVAALGVAERMFPALRPSEAMDRFPLVRPAAAARPAGRARARPRPAWGAMAGFAALGIGGLAGMLRGRGMWA